MCVIAELLWTNVTYVCLTAAAWTSNTTYVSAIELRGLNPPKATSSSWSAKDAPKVAKILIKMVVSISEVMNSLMMLQKVDEFLFEMKVFVSKVMGTYRIWPSSPA